MQLQYSGLKGGDSLLKTLKSAIANAETIHGCAEKRFESAEVRVDCGPIIKRSKSKNRGGVVPIIKGQVILQL